MMRRVGQWLDTVAEHANLIYAMMTTYVAPLLCSQAKCGGTQISYVQ